MGRGGVLPGILWILRLASGCILLPRGMPRPGSSVCSCLQLFAPWGVGAAGWWVYEDSYSVRCGSSHDLGNVTCIAGSRDSVWCVCSPSSCLLLPPPHHVLVLFFLPQVLQAQGCECGCGVLMGCH